jgi:hypothetical protein
MSTNPFLDLETVDQLLIGVIGDNRGKVVGWMQEQPGCWGFLAGQAVVACRRRAGRPLAEEERRLVWSRLWRLLGQLKAQTLG